MARGDRYMSSEFTDPMVESRRRPSGSARRPDNNISTNEPSTSCFASTTVAKGLFVVALVTSIVAGTALGYLFYPSNFQINENPGIGGSVAIQTDGSEEEILISEVETTTRTSTTVSSTQYSSKNTQKNFEERDPSTDAITGNVVSTSNRKWVGVNSHTCGRIDSGTKNTLLMRANFNDLIQKISHVDPRNADFTTRFGRIVGGRGVSIKSHPWQVGLWTKVGHTCGGSLIASNWVLTAAHCTAVFKDPKDWRIFLGETNRLNMGSLISDDGLQFAEASNVITHAQFNADNYDNDIALIRLLDHVVLTDYTNTICLPPPNIKLANGTKCLVSGWGLTTEGGDVPDSLREASVDIIERSICNHPDWLMGMVTNLMLCAGTIDGSQDACQGDSGGPLVCLLPAVKDTFYLVGSVSWGIGCGVPFMPGVYADLSLFRSWIDETIRDTETQYR